MNVAAFEQRVAKDGERPALPAGWPDPLQRLLSECWLSDSHARPDFAQLVPRIEAMLAEEHAAAKRGQRISSIMRTEASWEPRSPMCAETSPSASQ